MRKIHYISFYLNKDEIEGRKLEVAAQSKISYIIESIKRAGFGVNAVSTTFSEDCETFSQQKVVNIDNQETHIYLAAMGSQNKILKKFRRTFMQLQLLCYLLTKVKKDEFVLAYHSLTYIPILKLFKKS